MFPLFRIAKQFENTVNALKTVKLQTINGDMETALLKIAAASYIEYKFHYSMGASFMTNNTIIAWHNNYLSHSSPIALNLVHMSIIKAFASDGYSISVTNEPLSIQPEDEVSDIELLWQADVAFEFMFPFIVYIIMAILSAKYTSFYIEVCGSIPLTNSFLICYANSNGIAFYFTGEAM